MIACELFKKQPAGTKIDSQTHTHSASISLVVQRPQRLTDAYRRFTGCYITSSHPANRFSILNPSQLIAQRAKPETLFTLRLPLQSCDEKKANEVVQPTVHNFLINALHKP